MFYLRCKELSSRQMQDDFGYNSAIITKCQDTIAVSAACIFYLLVICVGGKNVFQIICFDIMRCLY